jgi:hypothetical protein
LHIDLFGPRIDHGAVSATPGEPTRDAGWTWPSAGIPGGAWALLALAAVAVIVGAVMRGFYGWEWYWDLQLVFRAVPSALPIVVGAAALAGAFRWPRSGRSLLAGAGVLALNGVLTVIGDTWIFAWSNWIATAPNELQQGLAIAQAQIAELSLIGGLALLAIGLWRGGDPSNQIAGWRLLAMLATVVLGAVALGGVAAYVAAAMQALPVTPPIEIVYWAFLILEVVSATALAAVAVRAIPDRHRLPEIAIATGAMIWTISRGGVNWLISIPPGDIPDDVVLVFTRGAVIGLVVVAAGFLSARLFPARPA